MLVSLSTRHSFLFRPHGDFFLRLIKKFVLDRNETVSSAYCTACGYLARLASDIEVLAVVDFSKNLYFESEGKSPELAESYYLTTQVETRQRVVSADIIQAISR